MIKGGKNEKKHILEVEFLGFFIPRFFFFFFFGGGGGGGEGGLTVFFCVFLIYIHLSKVFKACSVLIEAQRPFRQPRCHLAEI